MSCYCYTSTCILSFIFPLNLCVSVFPVEDRVQKQQRKHRKRGRHATSTGQFLYFAEKKNAQVKHRWSAVGQMQRKKEKKASERLSQNMRKSCRKRTRQRQTDKERGNADTGGRRESISVCVPWRALPTYQPVDHRGLMGTLNPVATHIYCKQRFIRARHLQPNRLSTEK